METIYFLIFVGVCAFVVVFATRKSRRTTDLATGSKPRQTKPSSESLKTPVDNRLAHSEQIWEARRRRVAKGYQEQPSYTPKSASGGDPEYDGYSRRDRHHVTASGHVKEEAHIDEAEKPSMTLIKFGSGKHAART